MTNIVGYFYCGLVDTNDFICNAYKLLLSLIIFTLMWLLVDALSLKPSYGKTWWCCRMWIFWAGKALFSDAFLFVLINAMHLGQSYPFCNLHCTAQISLFCIQLIEHKLCYDVCMPTYVQIWMHDEILSEYKHFCLLQSFWRIHHTSHSFTFSANESCGRLVAVLKKTMILIWINWAF